jgi:hypothetical protein
MKLSEVILVPRQQSSGLDLSKFNNLKRFKKAKVEKYPLLYKKSGETYFFALELDDKLRVFLVAKEISDIKNAIMIKRSFVDNSYRNQGLMTALYNTLNNQGFTLISDRELSPESLSIWKRLKSIHPVKVINRDTKEIRDLSKDDFLPNSDERELDHFILEERRWGPLKNNDLVEELNIFIKR